MTRLQVHCRGRLCIADLERAETFASRLIGLLGRKELPAGSGLLLQPAGSIHTFGMQFSIDVIQLDVDGRVIRRVQGVRPYRMVPACWRVRRVIEVQSGWLDPDGIQTGDCLSIGPVA
ncbi:MAG: hypothetical protein A2498_15650 [Lentisphaerae bacterium RIFOXYC12_FULL_60_16]|nr:MAG: hypothetical protein A2498_15650 [Lentisphaerae bacterium RIFOXYC12_FULL_60_16]OGV83778.1 MAG: hypothetical protein A2340_11140 [Lentisphaerae bacterium RIFOXYB12_FULL_60_10]